MKRWLFNIIGAGSLALCVTILVLWVYSGVSGGMYLYERPVVTRRDEITGRIQVICGRAGVHVEVGDSEDCAGLRTRIDRWSIPGAELARMSIRDRGYRADVSYWVILSMFGSLGLLWLLWLLFGPAAQRRQRLAAGLCVQCGYDLRASQDRCPECGTAIPGDIVRKPIA